MSRNSPQSISPPRGSRHTRPESDANIRNFAPVARIMKTALPENAKIAKEAKECMQECVSEFISFITSEGAHPPSALFLPSPALLLALTLRTFSFGEVSAREAKDSQRRRHPVRYDIARLRKLCRSAQDLSGQISRGKLFFSTTSDFCLLHYSWLSL